jgi:Protein of unknown function (DUF4031)
MAVYVDDVRHRYGRMIMCHMWADTLGELMAMVQRIGVPSRWLQAPPKSSWVHFDISLGKKALAIASGAVLTDKYGPIEFEARRRGDAKKLEMIAAARAVRPNA